MENTWGIVQSVDPLEVRFAGDSTDVPVAVSAFTPSVGQKVMLTKLGARDGWAIVRALTGAAWTAATFENSWVDYGLGYAPAGFQKIDDRVFLRGIIKSGSLSAAAFTLPDGFRPPYTVQASAAGTADRVEITPAGLVIPLGGTNAAAGLDSVSFAVTA